jgi:hypothetical protein
MLKPIQPLMLDRTVIALPPPIPTPPGLHESSASFIFRLASMHRVGLTKLYEYLHEQFPIYNNPDSFENRIPQLHSTGRCSDLLYPLLRNSPAHHELLRAWDADSALTELFSYSGLHRNRPALPQKLAGPAYIPSYCWLRSAQHWPLDGTQLIDKCLNCNRFSSSRSGLRPFPFCKGCGADLCKSNTPSLGSDFSKWCDTQIQELLYELTIGRFPKSYTLARACALNVDSLGVSRCRFINDFKICSYGYFIAAVSGKSRLSIQMVLRLCWILDIRLVDWIWLKVPKANRTLRELPLDQQYCRIHQIQARKERIAERLGEILESIPKYKDYKIAELYALADINYTIAYARYPELATKLRCALKPKAFNQSVA